MRFLALDQGTTSTRALILDVDGSAKRRLTHLLALPHRQHYPRPGWVEHDPAELLSNLRACIDAGRGMGVQAAGLANQGESCLGWDATTGEPVGPVIVWQDNRTADVVARLREDGAGALVKARTGLPLDPYFSASKLAWILREVPQAHALAARGRLRLGTTDAWFRQQLTGSCATDVSTASRTALMDLATCRWDAELCALFGVPLDCLPPITPTTGRLGMLDTLPLSASVVDQQAALYGHGCRKRGDVKITFGTGAFALALTGDGVEDATGSSASRAAGGAGLAPDGLVPTVAWGLGAAPPVLALDGGIYAASSAVNWARGLGLFSDMAEIGEFNAPPAVARGLTFVPALAGLACPHWDRNARGAWMGLSLDHGPRDLMQALLEGVAFRMAEVIARLEAALPLADVIPVDGGMSANPWFCQFLADALGRRILIAEEAELTALGTAALAAAGTGVPVDLTPQGRIREPRPQPASWANRFAAARQAVQGYGATAAATATFSDP